MYKAYFKCNARYIYFLITDLEGLTTDDTDTHLLIFRDDTLTVQSLDGNRLDLDSINLDSTILPHSIVENIEVECDRTLLEDTNMISQVKTNYVICIDFRKISSY